MTEGAQPSPQPLILLEETVIICAILTWGGDLLIRPVPSFQWVRELRNRLDLKDVDYVVYSSGYLTLIKLDPWTHVLDEEEWVELWGNPAHRKPAWDRDEE
ncbi:hypothetical protein MNV_1210016 [Candidatus Methanoperedens nitroreducens]|uniref:Uncharacterized protein n=1 Tax=Candidatus Methanoperedens nitratireducens TaxID=1392998 RepID=A0A284VJU3_9EURY|nr:hypothetical protein MNV_1210016 [Candidatus Methanoperedens nitroreducens]